MARTLALALLAASSASASPQWSVAPLSVPRTSINAVTLDGKALLAGGIDVATNSLTDVVDVYDFESGTWSTMTLPAPSYAAGATAVGEYALFLSHAHFSADVWAFSSVSGSWTRARLSVPRGRARAVAVGGRAIFAGGETFGVGSRATDVFDSAAGAPSDPAAWTDTELSYQRSPNFAMVHDGRAWIFGGADALAYSRRVDVYDSSNGSWDSFDFPSNTVQLIGTNVADLGVVVSSFGGDSRFEFIDLETRAVLPGPLLGQDVTIAIRYAAFTSGHRAFFVGPDFDDPTTGVAHVYDRVADHWSTHPLPIASERMSVTTFGAQAILAGGTEADSVLHFDDRIGSTYCTPSVANSAGTHGRIEAQGFPATAVDGSTRLNVTGLPAGAFGYIIASRTPGFGQPAASAGPLCLGGSIVRFLAPEFLLDGAEGSVGFPHAGITGLGDLSISAGETWHYQCWYRDASAALPSNFTDAVAVTYL